MTDIKRKHTNGRSSFNATILIQLKEESTIKNNPGCSNEGSKGPNQFKWLNEMNHGNINTQ